MSYGNTHSCYIKLLNILFFPLKMPWTEWVFFLPNNIKFIKCSFRLLGSWMDARFEGESCGAEELGFLHACFPSDSFQTRPINKEPPFLHLLQRSRSSSTHAIIHINQTSALHHEVYPALELWISAALIPLWRETAFSVWGQTATPTDFHNIPAMRFGVCLIALALFVELDPDSVLYRLLLVPWCFWEMPPVRALSADILVFIFCFHS